MDVKGVNRVIYWTFFFIFLLLLLFTFSSMRMPLMFRLLVLLLMAVLSSRYRLEHLTGFVSIGLTCLAGAISGAILSTSWGEFVIFTVLFIGTFFSSIRVWEQNLLGLSPDKK